mmetsp:Transcript_899/g.1890  ORF Transcript_899/g.1890 Transcript_899/m.1890 type:complete len:799 (-) Transcript_899:173-2569(-)|eukprot:CAMPEP_0197190606 /NCGR_PEP_ID=MMETSP1423-20130617/21953_1 /TAXON_ID=476441 /ORGANISM="Pseudo-nitzschia heimii, Strain UNC1101" /LENGTH=798 /DNA_ID=CAMNT_0042643019 /DNA_START=14 /DNA_END=2410 /DNA_ORIENTATION=-
MSNNDDIECNVGERGIGSSRCSVNISGRKRRYLVIPETEHELRSLEDAYCDDPDDQQGNEVRGKHCNDREKYEGCLPSHDASASSSHRRNRRMLPSSQVLISMMDDTNISGKSESDARSTKKKESLLLKNFHKSIGIQDHPRLTNSPTVEDIATSDEKRARLVIDEIDDPSLSTVSAGQHRRYLQLTTDSRNNQKSKRTFSQRKELKKLHDMVLKEQALYRSALDKFHNCYKSRYLIGFQSNSSDEMEHDGKTGASAFSRWSCFQAQAINREWEKEIAVHPDFTNPKPSGDIDKTELQHLPATYGTARQTFALHANTQQSHFDIQDLTCSVVHQTISTSQVRSSLSSVTSQDANIPEVSLKDIENNENGDVMKRILPPTIAFAPAVRLLGNDRKALELAAKYSATIVTTSETLEMLLRLPGDHSAKWTIPCITKTMPVSTPGSASTSSSSSSVFILDLPIAQSFPSPRSCLEMGFQEGLYQAFLKQHQSLQTEMKSDKASPPLSQVAYSLWTLPTKNTGVKNGSRKPVRVIVRTLVRLRDSVSKLPIRLRACVEYFSSPVNSGGKTNTCGRREIPNSYEKSLWILDQVLFGHQVLCLQYRIDPATCEVLGCYPTSIAHAFASSSSDGISNASKAHRSDLGPLNNWKVLIQLLQSIPSIDIPKALLRLPGLVGERKNTANHANEEKSLRQTAPGAVQTDHDTPHQQVRVDQFSVSVHAPCESSSVSKRKQFEPTNSTNSSSFSASTSRMISLDKNMLGQAGTVVLGDQALLDCRREWEWDRLDQVPNTFPVVNLGDTSG